MALFSSEQLNFFKFSAVVLDEFPVALRNVFVSMWDNQVAPKHGCQKWDNSVAVRNLFLGFEGGVPKVPTLNKSYEEWDCTALFKATLFSQTFAMPDGSGHLSTLDKLYVKPRGVSSKAFHTSVMSPGNQAETFALALDQLRRLRNTLCHQTSTRKIDKPTFDHYILLAKDAFAALGQDSNKIDDIGKLGEDDFPTTRVQQLEDKLRKEKDAAIRFNQIENHLNQIGSDVKDVKTGVSDVTAKVEEMSSDLKEIKANMEDLNQAKQAERSKGLLAPASCIPPKIPYFFGRQEECRAILDHLSKEDTRLVDICGPPGFGKTSVATNVARHLQEMKIPVYFISVRGMKSKDELVSRLLSIFADTTQLPDISSSHWLIQSLRQLKDPFVLVLDNADDLLESEDVETKEEVLKFTDDILAQCSHAKLLFTTRESLDYLSYKLSIHIEKVSVLDETSSASLVKSQLPDVLEDSCRTIVKECGQVPLAMRLMCGIISEENISVGELVLELKKSPLVSVLDNERFSDDVRLKTIINTSFQRLRGNERDVFVSLAVFPGRFELKEATEVLALKQDRPSKLIRSLEQKSLIDGSEGSFTIHPLLRSFIDEKSRTDKAVGDVLSRAQHRFFDHHISAFGVASETFLTGQSIDAVHAFFGQRENILFSLENGIKVDELYSKAVEILSKAELFLYAVLPDEESVFNMLYDTAVTEAKKRQISADERKLIAAKSFGQWGWFSEDRQTWDHSLYGGCSNSADYPAKLLCYHGVHQLLCGKVIEGIESIESSLDHLGSFCDEEVLKELASQVLAESRGKNMSNEERLLHLAASMRAMGNRMEKHFNEEMRMEHSGLFLLSALHKGISVLINQEFHPLFGLICLVLGSVIDLVWFKTVEVNKEPTQESDGNRTNPIDGVIFFCVRMKLLNYVNREKRFQCKTGASGSASRDLGSSLEIASFLNECSKALRMMSSLITELESNSALVKERGISDSLSLLASIIDRLSPDSWYPLLICNEALRQVDSILSILPLPPSEGDAWASLKEQVGHLRGQLQITN